MKRSVLGPRLRSRPARPRARTPRRPAQNVPAPESGRRVAPASPGRHPAGRCWPGSRPPWPPWQRPQPPTALVASDSVVAMWLLREVTQRGLRIPADLSFVMYDNFPWSEIVTPPLTVVAQPVYEMGREAARRLIAEIRGEAVGPMPRFDARLMIRQSIAAPASLISGK